MANELKHKSAGTVLSQAEYEDILGHQLDGQTEDDIVYASSATQLSRLAMAASRVVAKLATGGLVAATVAEMKTLLNWSQMAENDPLLLDATLSADGTYSGIAEAGTAGAILAFGDLVYYAVADSKWELTDADAAATAFGKIGICILAAAENAATVILLWGKVNAATAFPDLTIGAPVFVGVTAGDVQVAAPTGTGDIVRIVGYGNTIDELFFCPDNTYLELV